MKKKTVLWIALELVFLLVFNLAFFVAGGTSHPASVWISYGFVHFAYLMLVATPFLVRKSSSAAVFGFSIATVSSTYFFVALIAAIVFFILKQDSYKTALIVHAVLAAVYLIMLLSHLIANEKTADDVARHETEVAFLKQASSRVKLLEGKLSDKKADKQIEKLYDLLDSSPSRSNASVLSLETDLLDFISDLETAVASNNTDSAMALCAKATAVTEERNRRIKNA